MTSLTATWALARLALRRDRLRLFVWLAVLTALLAVSAATTRAEYATEEDLVVAARLIATSPALLVLRGPAADASEASLIMADIAPIVAGLLALLSALTVVRHSRHNEETGRAELVGSATVGRHAMLAAAFLVAAAASLAQGALFAGVLVASGLPLVGSLAAGAAMAGVGVAFAGVGGLAAQLAATAGTANMLAIAALGAAYLLRGLGDAFGQLTPEGTSITPGWPLWLSPFGWTQQVRPFDDPAWWLLAPLAALFAATAVAAVALSSRRDLGFGLIPPRPGPATADRGLLSPIGLAWRLQRRAFAAWAVGAAVIGAVFGSLGQQVRDLAANEQFRQLLGQLAGGAQDLGDALFAFAFAIIGVLAAAYAVQALLAMRTEESESHLEPVLGTTVARSAWLVSHLAIALLGTLGLLVAAGLSAALADGLVTDDLTARLGELTSAALVPAPAAFVLAGLVVAGFGMAPRLVVSLSWAALLSSLVLGLLGDVLDLPQALRDLSPFSHLPAVPAEAVDPLPLAILLALAAVLSAAGVIAFRRRDVPTS